MSTTRAVLALWQHQRRQSHSIVRQGLEILLNLDRHRERAIGRRTALSPTGGILIAPTLSAMVEFQQDFQPWRTMDEI